MKPHRCATPACLGPDHRFTCPDCGQHWRPAKRRGGGWRFVVSTGRDEPRVKVTAQ